MPGLAVENGGVPVRHSADGAQSVSGRLGGSMNNESGGEDKRRIKGLRR